MAGGWTQDGGVLDQIEDTVADGVSTARARMPAGEGSTHCVECGAEIPEARRRAQPGAHTCVPCQSGPRGRQNPGPPPPPPPGPPPRGALPGGGGQPCRTGRHHPAGEQRYPAAVTGRGCSPSDPPPLNPPPCCACPI